MLAETPRPVSDETPRWAWYLYWAHFISTWGERMWEYANMVFIYYIFPTSLMPLAIAGIAQTAVSIFLGPQTGSFVDNHARLPLMMWSIFIQNMATVVSALLFFILQRKAHLMTVPAIWGLYIATLVFGSIAVLSANVSTIAMEKDWVIVGSAHSRYALSNLNSAMKRIDLFCKLVAPIVVGAMAVWDREATVLLIAAWNGLSWFLEYPLMKKVYSAVPPLALPRQPVGNNSTSSKPESHCNCFATFRSGLRQWLASDACLPSLAYSLLYANVITFGGTMLAFVLWSNVTNELAVALLRAASAATGLLATYVTPCWIEVCLSIYLSIYLPIDIFIDIV
jgi:iron-regulated transporter 1